jgi:alpha-L-rhamnosidase
MLRVAPVFLLMASSALAMPVHLRTNALETPLAIDAKPPIFSWQSDAKTPNWTQSAYEVLVATDTKLLESGHTDVWDSGKTLSSESLNIVYAGTPLKPQQHYIWKVLTWDSHGKQTASAATWFETGLLDANSWKAWSIVSAKT